MISIHHKVQFVTAVMEALGYQSIEVVRAIDEDGVTYWLDGLKGFYKKGKNINNAVSFNRAQQLARSMLFVLKQPGKANWNRKFNFWNFDRILTLKEVAEIVGEAVYCSSPLVLAGGYKSVVYSHRTGRVKDESTGEVLGVVRRQGINKERTV
jgi:nucleoside-diphosphate-sugar epimerase